ncbi:MAG: hypothetical protein AAGM38_04790 [Pseudomonadota bacterium]
MIQMTIDHEAAAASPSFDPAPAEEPAEASFITVRRSGQRPLGFRGAVVAHGMSFRVGTPFWYELNVFRTATGGFVADIRHFTKADGEQDSFKVCVSDSLEEILDFFEGYEPAHDVKADLDLDQADIAVSELAFKALALRMKVEEARAQYEGMVSEIFAQLDEGLGVAG